MSKNLFKMVSMAVCMLLIWNASSAKTHTVWVGDGANTFDPQTFTAKVGDTVDWNWGAAGYNVQSTTIPAGAVSWNTGVHSDPFHYIYVIKVPGVYNYKDATHAGMTGTFTALASTSVGEVFTKPFTVGPIPANNEVSFTGDIRALNVDVYDLSGKRITTWTAANLSEKSFSVAAFSTGMYILFVNVDGKRYKEKLVVTH